jgi:hypothetical protein
MSKVLVKRVYNQYFYCKNTVYLRLRRVVRNAEFVQVAIDVFA